MRCVLFAAALVATAAVVARGALIVETPHQYELNFNFGGMVPGQCFENEVSCPLKAQAAGQTTTGKVNVMALSSRTRKQVRDAVVLLNGNVLEPYVTDKHGEVLISDVPPGCNRLEIDAAGFDGVNITVHSIVGQIVNLPVALNHTDPALSRGEMVNALLDAIVAQDPEPVTRYVSAQKYISHRVGPQAGRQGLIDGVVLSGIAASIVVHRTITDGDLVAAHATMTINGEAIGLQFNPVSNAWLLYRFEAGKIVEHWDSMVPDDLQATDGLTQTGGQTEIEHLEHTATNKLRARHIWDDVVVGGDLDKIATYFTATVGNHDPTIANGADGYRAHRAAAPTALSLRFLIGTGNFVVLAYDEAVTDATADAPSAAVYELWRFDAQGLVAETWRSVSLNGPPDYAPGRGPSLRW